MKDKSIAPHGTWKSAISPDFVARASTRLAYVQLHRDQVFWVEERAAAGGRCVVVRWDPERGTADVLPEPYSARSRVHEYGGCPYLVDEGVLFFVNQEDQRLYRGETGDNCVCLTPAHAIRYADGCSDPHRRRTIWVAEAHENGLSRNYLAGVPMQPGGDIRPLASGRDFYAAPRLSPDGGKLAWLAWDQPEMPWDGAELWLADLDASGALLGARRIAGGGGEAVLQPEWSPDGALYFVSDRDNWWNIHRYERGKVECLCRLEAEFGRPPWVLGMSQYGFVSADWILCAYTSGGLWQLGLMEASSGDLEPVDTPYTEISFLRVGAGQAVFCGAGPLIPPQVVRFDLDNHRFEVLRNPEEVQVDRRWISVPQAVSFESGPEETAHGFFYPPTNPEYRSPGEELPPLIVRGHGGPTAATSTGLAWDVQFWTSRGFAFFDLNYRGSTGYGRRYRERLYGGWGRVDVEDAVAAARHLVAAGRVDPHRLIIRGSSAGGYLALCALVFHRLFHAGVVYYGISDLEALVQQTHKFEAHYLERLVGPYPRQRHLYRQRSPLHFASRISCPVLFFQGLDDKVVPPAQSEAIVEVLQQSGGAAAYVAFAGEGHGFRRGNTIKGALKIELAFYARIFGFEPADPVPEVEIYNFRPA